MIIKSMSGKKPAFGKLVSYIARHGIDKKYSFTQNLGTCSIADEADITNEFVENSQYLAKRKNGNYLYHEIISLEKNDHIAQKEQEKVLFDLVQQYAQARAPDQLVFGRMHRDSGNLHFHLLISANAPYSRQRLRLSKSQFVQIERNLEQYKLEKYPHFDQTRLHTKDHQKEKTNSREYALKKRTKKESQKDRIKSIFLDVLKTSKSNQELIIELGKKGFEFYQRGKNWGLLEKNSNRKYRLKTLGVQDNFLQRLEDFKRLTERKVELNKVRELQEEKRNELERENR